MARSADVVGYGHSISSPSLTLPTNTILMDTYEASRRRPLPNAHVETDTLLFGKTQSRWQQILRTQQFSESGTAAVSLPAYNDGFVVCAWGWRTDWQIKPYWIHSK